MIVAVAVAGWVAAGWVVVAAVISRMDESVGPPWGEYPLMMLMMSSHVAAAAAADTFYLKSAAAAAAAAVVVLVDVDFATIQNFAAVISPLVSSRWHSDRRPQVHHGP